MCRECNACPFLEMCYGNCKRLNVAYFDEAYCGYKEFLIYTEKSMREIASKIEY
jgi:uncharacterized protein